MPSIRLRALGVALAASAVALPALASAPAHATPAELGSRTLSYGMVGKDVRTAQVLLRRTGASLTIDNQFGPRTLSAVRRFERQHGGSPDGRLDASDVRLLRSAAEAAVAARRSGAATPRQLVASEPAPTEGAAQGTPSPTVPGAKATLNADGTANAPADAPQQVKDIIAAGNRIASKPYKYGGGHGRWEDSGYDCSGSVSYALRGAGLLDDAMPSGGFTSWGESGAGEWVTIYAHGGHMYMVVAGLRFDTSGAKPSRWQTDMRSARGYTVRHPKGL